MLQKVNNTTNRHQIFFKVQVLLKVSLQKHILFILEWNAILSQIYVILALGIQDLLFPKKHLKRNK